MKRKAVGGSSKSTLPHRTQIYPVVLQDQNTIGPLGIIPLIYPLTNAVEIFEIVTIMKNVPSWEYNPVADIIETVFILANEYHLKIEESPLALIDHFHKSLMFHLHKRNNIRSNNSTSQASGTPLVHKDYNAPAISANVRLSLDTETSNYNIQKSHSICFRVNQESTHRRRKTLFRYHSKNPVEWLSQWVETCCLWISLQMNKVSRTQMISTTKTGVLSDSSPSSILRCPADSLQSNEMDDNAVDSLQQSIDRKSPSEMMIKHLLQQSYLRLMVKKTPKSISGLRGAAASNPSLAYGELSMDLVDIIRCQVRNTARQWSFVDLGSGIGNIVLQMALYPDCKSAVGVEIQSHLHQLALEYREELLYRCAHLYGYQSLHQKILTSSQFVHGDFFNQQTSFLANADVVLVNNFTFDAMMNHRLLLLFLDLKPETIVISLLPFISPRRRDVIFVDSKHDENIHSVNDDNLLSTHVDTNNPRYKSEGNHIYFEKTGKNKSIVNKEADKTSYAPLNNPISISPSPMGTSMSSYKAMRSQVAFSHPELTHGKLGYDFTTKTKKIRNDSKLPVGPKKHSTPELLTIDRDGFLDDYTVASDLGLAIFHPVIKAIPYTPEMVSWTSAPGVVYLHKVRKLR